MRGTTSVARIAAAIALAGGTLPAADGVALTVAREGQATAAIALAAAPTKAAQFAAYELQWHVKQISGAELPVLREAADKPLAVPDGQVTIYVGDTSRARALGFTQAAFAPQEYAVHSGVGEIVLVGRDADDRSEVKCTFEQLSDWQANANWPGYWEERGTLNAAYDFLRDACGVRWYNPTDTGTLMPQQPTLAVAPLNLRRAPTFRCRDADGGGRYDNLITVYSSAKGEAKRDAWTALEAAAYADLRKLYPDRPRHDYTWAKRHTLKLFLLRMKNGGEKCACNHSLYHYYELYWAPRGAPEYFVKKRPELFAQGYDGDKPPQMCYSNPDLVRLAAEEARDYFANGGYPYKKTLCNAPLAMKWGENFFAVEPMDNPSFCKCPDCLKWLEVGRDHGNVEYYSRGIHSDYMFRFVNAVQLAFAQLCPGTDKHLVTLAYMTHAWVPKLVKLDPAVAVQFCFASSGSPGSGGGYENDLRLLREWSEEAEAAEGRPLYLWLYNMTRSFANHYGDFYCFPDFYGHTLDKQMKLFRELGYRGMFFCGHCLDVDAYLAFRLMDNVDLDVDALLDDYFTGMYGPAAAPLKKLYLGLETVYVDPALRPGKESLTRDVVAWGYLGTAERMAGWSELMDQARALTSGATETQRRNVELFDAGIWQYMVKGRAAYEKRHAVARSLGVACPLDSEYQSYGSGGWRRDSGDFSLRKISSAMRHDGKGWHLKFVEEDLDRLPADGERWEIVFFDRQNGESRRLFVAPNGEISGQTQSAGLPREWADHGATAKSAVTGRTWTVELTVPLRQELQDTSGRVFMNCRRSDGAGADIPVLVTTGGAFGSGSTCAVVSFDPPLSGVPVPPPDEGLLLHWDFSGDGEMARDRSGHGNDGRIVGEATRVKNGIQFTGGDQYVEIQNVQGLEPTNYTLNCWMFYTNADRRGHLQIFTTGSLRGTLGVPYRKLGFLNREGPNGKPVGAGPMGVELVPNVWHMFTMARDDTHFSVYENGRFRGRLDVKRFKPDGGETSWYIGGRPELQPWYTFLGTLSDVQFYGRALSPPEVMGKYEAEHRTRRSDAGE